MNLQRHHYPPYYSISGIHINTCEHEEADDFEEVQVLLLGREGGGSISISSTPRSSSPVDETQPDGNHSTDPADAMGEMNRGGQNGCEENNGMAELDGRLNEDPDNDNNQRVSVRICLYIATYSQVPSTGVLFTSKAAKLKAMLR